MGSMSTVESSQQLPPGFRFHPTDEELILHYLKNKASTNQCPVSIIAEVDIYKFNPWDLPAKAAYGEREWYFFSPRDRKYPNGERPNRAAASGYWKATGTDKLILGRNKEKIGIKKALVFYKGRPPKGVKTNWIMHEYRLSQSLLSNTGDKCDSSYINIGRYKLSNNRPMRLDDCVLCRIYVKNNSSPTMNIMHKEKEAPRICNTAALASSPNITNHGWTLQTDPLDSLIHFPSLSQLLQGNRTESTHSQLIPNYIDDRANHSSSSSTCYALQMLPKQDLPVFMTMENQLDTSDIDHSGLDPSKIIDGSSTFTTSTHVDSSFYNQYIHSNSNLDQFQ